MIMSYKRGYQIKPNKINEKKIIKRKYELVIDGKIICADNVYHYQAINEFEWDIKAFFSPMNKTEFENLYNDFQSDGNGWTAVYFDHIVEIRRA